MNTKTKVKQRTASLKQFIRKAYTAFSFDFYSENDYALIICVQQRSAGGFYAKGYQVRSTKDLETLYKDSESSEKYGLFVVKQSICGFIQLIHPEDLKTKKVKI